MPGMLPELSFRVPSSEDFAALTSYRAEVLAGDGEFDGSAGLGEFSELSDWLTRVRILGGTRAEKYGYYRTLVRLAFDGETLVGILNVRLSEDVFVRTYAGHIGYHIRPSCRRKGYGQACALEAVRLCAENGIVCPVICTMPQNLASGKTAEKAGFFCAGTAVTETGITVVRYEMGKHE